MTLNISRRDFLKTTSVAAAGATAASITPFSSAYAKHDRISRVVISKDTSCMTGSTPVVDKIQDMVDYSIMALAGLTDKGAAYEDLFPAPVTSSTKILLKRNDISGPGSPSNKTVVDCLKIGLQSMLNGTFDASNISILNKQTGTSSNTGITCGGQNFYLKQDIVNADYVINCPVCWAHSAAYAVTLSMKNTMNYIAVPNDFHSLDSTQCWLWECSNSEKVQERQVLAVMDAIHGNHVSGPGSSVKFTAHTLIVSKDIVAVDYHAVEIMDEQGITSSRLSTARSQLSKAAQSGLGTNEPNNMEVIEIGPPWNTGVIDNSKTLMEKMNVQVIHGGNRIDFILPESSVKSADVAIFDMSGRGIWAAREVNESKLTWDCRGNSQIPVADGMYIFKIKAGKQILKGTVTISR